MIKLPPLPYADTALEPYVSKETIAFHYGKHHQAYVDFVQKNTCDTDLASLSLEELLKVAQGALWNNAAQVWNHTFYWNSMSPVLRTHPKNDLARAIDTAFGSFDNFKQSFTQQALSHFGSGWVWLASDTEKKLKIVCTSNAGTLALGPDIPLLVLDVWEHAYYIDHRNARARHIEAFWSVVAWSKADERFSQI